MPRPVHFPFTGRASMLKRRPLVNDFGALYSRASVPSLRQAHARVCESCVNLAEPPACSFCSKHPPSLYLPLFCRSVPLKFCRYVDNGLNTMGLAVDSEAMKQD